MTSIDKVNKIIKDLSGRSGLDNEWGNIDSDIQDEIRSTWIDFISQTSSPEKALENIIRDLDGRRGIGSCWSGIDMDIQQEIKDIWLNILKN